MPRGGLVVGLGWRATPRYKSNFLMMDWTDSRRLALSLDFQDIVADSLNVITTLDNEQSDCC